jgi:5-methylcytosine-specific restriction endonuclease McrA
MRHWIAQRYWRTNQGHGWVLATHDGLALNRHGAVPIVRHGKVRDTASPFNGDSRYWAARRGCYPGIPRRVAALLKRQGGRCQHCGLFFTPQALLEVHHVNSDRRNNAYSNLAAVHRHCHDQIHGGPRERSSRQGAHDKNPIDRGAMCRESGTHGFGDQRGSDPLAEFTRALRFAVLWRKLMQGTYNEKGDRWVERILSVRETCRLRGRPTFPVLVEAVTCYFNGQPPAVSWI